MRPSNRSHILDAAVRVVERAGVSGVTYESVAAEAGLTRGGLLYHFPSREALLQAIHDHMAAIWEQDMLQAAGADDTPAEAHARHAAYARASVRGATRAELLLLIEGGSNPAHAAPWRTVMERWSPPPPANLHDPAALARFIARLAADGLWLHAAMVESPLPDPLRQAIAEHLTRALQAPAAAPAAAVRQPEQG